MIPTHRLTKDEINWLASHKCKHHHTYLDHYNCYITDNPDREKTGFFDLEASNLSADFGILLSYAIKDASSETIHSATIQVKDLEESLDRKLVKQCVEDMLRFDKLIGFYSTKFDMPFIRTRAVMHGLEFPVYGTIQHKDVYYIVRNKFRLSRNRQENACRALLGHTEKTHIEPVYWIKALMGDKKSLAYIHDHNIKDVLDLERLYKTVIDFNKGVTNSI